MSIPMLSMPVSRRQVLSAALMAAGAAVLRPWPALASASGTREYSLELAPARVPMLDAATAPVDVWAYNAQVPGPVLRVKQGERLTVTVTNRLEEATTVHWHGLRLPNAMDGVPHLTQPPIEPGGRFVYAFDCPDAGTFWYHPHLRSHEQTGRGLYGALIVEDAQPPVVDRELLWVLDDWRVTKQGQLSDTFGDPHDIAHGGMIGNVVTVNGVLPTAVSLRAGERVRLRLINAANARHFALQFEGHHPQVIAIDGQPVEPHAPDGDLVVLAPAMRVDVILNAGGEPDSRHRVIDRFYRDMAYQVLELAYAPQRLREAPPDDAVVLAANPLSEPDLYAAEAHEIRFQGGMMGSLQGATVEGRPVNMMDAMRAGRAWAVNGVIATGHVHEPILELVKGRSYRLRLVNETRWHHPIHLHGHSFRVLSRNGQPTPRREWQDTVMMSPQETVEIAFVADNPGDWMLHCHILEHQLGGMMAVVRVA